MLWTQQSQLKGFFWRVDGDNSWEKDAPQKFFVLYLLLQEFEISHHNKKLRHHSFGEYLMQKSNVSFSVNFQQVNSCFEGWVLAVKLLPASHAVLFLW